jgi:membrane associated rhomboid family serine protease
MLIAFYAYMSQENIKTAMLWIFLISIMPLVLGLNIAWWAHLVGAILGALIAKIILKNYYRH